MTVQLSPVPVFKAFDNNGEPLAGGLLYTYVAGTTTPQVTYINSTQTTQNTNPIILNARGEGSVWLDVTLVYKLLLTDSLGNTIPGWPVDNIQEVAALTQAIFNSFLLTAGGANLAGNVTLGGTGFTIGGFGPTAGGLQVDMTPDFGSFLTNGSGFVSGPTGTVNWVRIGRLVIVALPALTGISNFDAFNITNWPAEIQPPTVAQNIVIPGINNSVAAVLLLGISASPTPIVNLQMSDGTFSSSGFATSGTKGFAAITFAYLLT